MSKGFTPLHRKVITTGQILALVACLLLPNITAKEIQFKTIETVHLKQIDAREDDALRRGKQIEVSAYNVGDESQTDDSPCTGAWGDNLCELIPEYRMLGKAICASNQFNRGTVIHIDGFGDCVIMDGMNSRYLNNIDIAFPLGEKVEAIQVGRRLINYYVK